MKYFFMFIWCVSLISGQDYEGNDLFSTFRKLIDTNDEKYLNQDQMSEYAENYQPNPTRVETTDSLMQTNFEEPIVEKPPKKPEEITFLVKKEKPNYVEFTNKIYHEIKSAFKDYNINVPHENFTSVYEEHLINGISYGDYESVMKIRILQKKENRPMTIRFETTGNDKSKMTLMTSYNSDFNEINKMAIKKAVWKFAQVIQQRFFTLQSMKDTIDQMFKLDEEGVQEEIKDEQTKDQEIDFTEDQDYQNYVKDFKEEKSLSDFIQPQTESKDQTLNLTDDQLQENFMEIMSNFYKNGQERRLKEKPKNNRSLDDQQIREEILQDLQRTKQKLHNLPQTDPVLNQNQADQQKFYDTLSLMIKPVILQMNQDLFKEGGFCDKSPIGATGRKLTLKKLQNPLMQMALISQKFKKSKKQDRKLILGIGGDDNQIGKDDIMNIVLLKMLQKAGNKCDACEGQKSLLLPILLMMNGKGAFGKSGGGGILGGGSDNNNMLMPLILMSALGGGSGKSNNLLPIILLMNQKNSGGGFLSSSDDNPLQNLLMLQLVTGGGLMGRKLGKESLMSLMSPKDPIETLDNYNKPENTINQEVIRKLFSEKKEMSPTMMYLMMKDKNDTCSVLRQLKQQDGNIDIDKDLLVDYTKGSIKDSVYGQMVNLEYFDNQINNIRKRCQCRKGMKDDNKLQEMKKQILSLKNNVIQNYAEREKKLSDFFKILPKNFYQEQEKDLVQEYCQKQELMDNQKIQQRKMSQKKEIVEGKMKDQFEEIKEQLMKSRYVKSLIDQVKKKGRKLQDKDEGDKKDAGGDEKDAGGDEEEEEDDKGLDLSMLTMLLNSKQSEKGETLGDLTTLLPVLAATSFSNAEQVIPPPEEPQIKIQKALVEGDLCHCIKDKATYLIQEIRYVLRLIQKAQQCQRAVQTRSGRGAIDLMFELVKGYIMKQRTMVRMKVQMDADNAAFDKLQQYYQQAWDQKQQEIQQANQQQMDMMNASANMIKAAMGGKKRILAVDNDGKLQKGRILASEEDLLNDDKVSSAIRNDLEHYENKDYQERAYDEDLKRRRDDRNESWANIESEYRSKYEEEILNRLAIEQQMRLEAEQAKLQQMKDQKQYILDQQNKKDQLDNKKLSDSNLEKKREEEMKRIQNDNEKIKQQEKEDAKEREERIKQEKEEEKEKAKEFKEELRSKKLNFENELQEKEMQILNEKDSELEEDRNRRNQREEEERRRREERDKMLRDQELGRLKKQLRKKALKQMRKEIRRHMIKSLEIKNKVLKDSLKDKIQEKKEEAKVKKDKQKNLNGLNIDEEDDNRDDEDDDNFNDDEDDDDRDDDNFNDDEDDDDRDDDNFNDDEDDDGDNNKLNNQKDDTDEIIKELKQVDQEIRKDINDDNEEDLQKNSKNKINVNLEVNLDQNKKCEKEEKKSDKEESKNQDDIYDDEDLELNSDDSENFEDNDSNQIPLEDIENQEKIKNSQKIKETEVKEIEKLIDEKQLGELDVRKMEQNGLIEKEQVQKIDNYLQQSGNTSQNSSQHLTIQDIEKLTQGNVLDQQSAQKIINYLKNDKQIIKDDQVSNLNQKQQGDIEGGKDNKLINQEIDIEDNYLEQGYDQEQQVEQTSSMDNEIGQEKQVFDQLIKNISSGNYQQSDIEGLKKLNFSEEDIERFKKGQVNDDDFKKILNQGESQQSNIEDDYLQQGYDDSELDQDYEQKKIINNDMDIVNNNTNTNEKKSLLTYDQEESLRESNLQDSDIDYLKKNQVGKGVIEALQRDYYKDEELIILRRSKYSMNSIKKVIEERKKEVENDDVYTEENNRVSIPQENQDILEDKKIYGFYTEEQKQKMRLQLEQELNDPNSIINQGGNGTGLSLEEKQKMRQDFELILSQGIPNKDPSLIQKELDKQIEQEVNKMRNPENGSELTDSEKKIMKEKIHQKMMKDMNIIKEDEDNQQFLQTEKVIDEIDAIIEEEEKNINGDDLQSLYQKKVEREEDNLILDYQKDNFENPFHTLEDNTPLEEPEEAELITIESANETNRIEVDSNMIDPSPKCPKDIPEDIVKSIEPPQSIVSAKDLSFRDKELNDEIGQTESNTFEFDSAIFDDKKKEERPFLEQIYTQQTPEMFEIYNVDDLMKENPDRLMEQFKKKEDRLDYLLVPLDRRFGIMDLHIMYMRPLEDSESSINQQNALNEAQKPVLSHQVQILLKSSYFNISKQINLVTKNTLLYTIQNLYLRLRDKIYPELQRITNTHKQKFRSVQQSYQEKFEQEIIPKIDFAMKELDQNQIFYRNEEKEALLSPTKKSIVFSSSFFNVSNVNYKYDLAFGVYKDTVKIQFIYHKKIHKDKNFKDFKITRYYPIESLYNTFLWVEIFIRKLVKKLERMLPLLPDLRSKISSGLKSYAQKYYDRKSLRNPLNRHFRRSPDYKFAQWEENYLKLDLRKKHKIDHAVKKEEYLLRYQLTERSSNEITAEINSHQ